MSHLKAYNAGIRRNKRTQAANIAVPQGFEQTHRDLMAYNGTFNLLLNLRNAITRYGKLTDKQWAAAAKCLTQSAPKAPAQYDIKCNIPVTLKASAARKVARHNKWDFNPRTLVITGIKSYSVREGFVVTAKIDWTGNAQDCRCCARALTDWRSQATGVGPICVKRLPVKYVTNKADVVRFQQEMEAYCAKIGEFEVVLRHWSFDQGLHQLTNAILTSTAPESSTEVVTKINIKNCEWNPEARLLTCKGFTVPSDAKIVEVVNTSTGGRRVFKKLNDHVWTCVGDKMDLVFPAA